MNPMTLLFKPNPLHIPDGFLNLPIALIFWALSAALLGLAIKRTRGQLGERQIPLVGVMAAFIFAAQMINFPVAGGTSGHLLGGALAAIVLGPWTGMLVMTTVVVVQALLFQDGGLLVMGANIFNMGVLTVLTGYGLYRAVVNRNRTVRLMVGGIGAWLSVIAGALATSLQLWLSGTSALEFVIPAMLGVHALIGLGEALITVAGLAFITQTRPDLLERGGETNGEWGWILVGVAISAAVVLISPIASAYPDGLERVAINLGFIDRGIDSPYQLLPDYTLPILGQTGLSTILAGALGATIVGILTVSSVLLLRRSKET